MKMKKSKNILSGKAEQRRQESIDKVLAAERLANAARDHWRMLKVEQKQARKAFKQAKRAAKLARKEAEDLIKALKRSVKQKTTPKKAKQKKAKTA